MQLRSLNLSICLSFYMVSRVNKLLSVCVWCFFFFYCDETVNKKVCLLTIIRSNSVTTTHTHTHTHTYIYIYIYIYIDDVTVSCWTMRSSYTDWLWWSHSVCFLTELLLIRVKLALFFFDKVPFIFIWSRKRYRFSFHSVSGKWVLGTSWVPQHGKISQSITNISSFFTFSTSVFHILSYLQKVFFFFNYGKLNDSF